MRELTREHIVHELFKHSSAFYDAGGSPEQNALSDIFNRAAQMLEEEGSAAEKLALATTEVANKDAQIGRMSDEIQRLRERPHLEY